MAPKRIDHIIECGEVYEIDAFDADGNPVRHRVLPQPVDDSPPTPLVPTTSTGALIIKALRDAHGDLTLTIPSSRLRDRDLGKVVVHGLARADYLMIDLTRGHDR